MELWGMKPKEMSQGASRGRRALVTLHEEGEEILVRFDGD